MPLFKEPDGPNTFIAVIISENPKNPFVTQWTLSVERELARNTTLEVNYIGNKGSRLLARQNINQALPLINPPACYVDPEPGSCQPSNRRPYPNFVTYIDSSWIGHSNYNAMNFKFEHRTGQFAVTSVYTWSKSLDDKSTAASAGAEAQGWNGFLNNHNPEAGLRTLRLQRRPALRHQPGLRSTGRPRQAICQSGINPVVNAVIGGWETSAIATFQQGFPMSIQCYDYDVARTIRRLYGGLLDIATGFGINRCDQVGDPKKLKWTHNAPLPLPRMQALFAAPHTWDVWDLGAQRCHRARH